MTLFPIELADEDFVNDYIDGFIAMQRLADTSDVVISSEELRRRLAKTLAPKSDASGLDDCKLSFERRDNFTSIEKAAHERMNIAGNHLRCQH